MLHGRETNQPFRDCYYYSQLSLNTTIHTKCHYSLSHRLEGYRGQDINTVLVQFDFRAYLVCPRTSFKAIFFSIQKYLIVEMWETQFLCWYLWTEYGKINGKFKDFSTIRVKEKQTLTFRGTAGIRDTVRNLKSLRGKFLSQWLKTSIWPMWNFTQVVPLIIADCKTGASLEASPSPYLSMF